MRPDDTKQQRPTTQIRDLPAVEAIDADDANNVKGGASIVSPRDPASGIVSPRDPASGVISPRDPASGLPTGKRF